MRIAAIGCLMIAIALLSMRTLGPSRARDHSFSFTKDFHVGVGAGGGWPGVWIYNDGAYGPYRGSIISVSDDDSIETREFGMTAGIYYRWFHRDGMTLWTLHIDL